MAGFQGCPLIFPLPSPPSGANKKPILERGGPGGEATLAGFGVSPKFPNPQKVLGLCTRETLHSNPGGSENTWNLSHLHVPSVTIWVPSVVFHWGRAAPIALLIVPSRSSKRVMVSSLPHRRFAHIRQVHSVMGLLARARSSAHCTRTSLI